MNESIFLLNNDGQLIEMNESGYITESHLQELLANYPNLISGSQINPTQPRRWLLISREFGVPDELNSSNRWSLDHLFIDQDGIPTLIEVKRSTDTRIRREVIGQVLDYAANAVTYWSIEEIKYRFEERCKMSSEDPSTTLLSFLSDDQDVDSFWEQTKTNLKAGKIRMLIVADTIPKEMQRIIEFLNEQMTPAEILGVEIKQFVNEGLKTLVPRVLGMTSNALIVKGQLHKEETNWTEDSFIKAIENKCGAQGVRFTNTVLDWAKNNVSYIWYGKGNKMGSFVPVVKGKDGERFSFALWTYGRVEIYFQYMKTKPPFDNEVLRLELFNRLNSIDGVNIPLDKADKRPSFPIDVLYNKEKANQFFTIFEWYLDKIKPYL